MKLYIVGIEWHEGSNDVVGIFESQGDAMYVASEINAHRYKDVKEVYTQEHELQPNSNKLMSLKQFDKFTKEEADL